MAIERLLRAAALAAIALACGGCMRGWLYTNARTPLVTDMDATPRGARMVEMASHHIHEPFTAAQVGAEWNVRAIGFTAKEFGLDTIYFADLHTVSWFGGIYRRQTVEVWGN